ncbi:hypothetical protein RINTU1_34540 [Candidatus Regiella insecticola]|uniref:Uncharacterized protein n=1 Tax=Candidatus Regiella insecticola TaxID=138073 RepID=A0A6L2ZSE1_9ENTR|nr:hypothetical protein RINTU1_34540 [Candidatus Regiella insecticola]
MTKTVSGDNYIDKHRSGSQKCWPRKKVKNTDAIRKKFVNVINKRDCVGG